MPPNPQNLPHATCLAFSILVLGLLLRRLIQLGSSSLRLSTQQTSTQVGVTGPPRVEEGVEAGEVVQTAAEEAGVLQQVEGALSKTRAMCTLGLVWNGSQSKVL